MGVGILRMPGKRIATGLTPLAMTHFSFPFAPIFVGSGKNQYVIASQFANWRGNPFSAMQSIASAVGRSHCPLNDHL